MRRCPRDRPHSTPIPRQSQADPNVGAAGSRVSVAGDALELRTDHSHAVLRVLCARDAVVFSDPITQPPQEG